MPETSTTAAVVLSTLNTGAFGVGPFSPGGLTAPLYQSRQQIGNFMFVTDGVNKQLHAVNSNTMEVIESLDLPDPYGLGMTSNLETLYVSNEGDNTVSVVDADPRSATFMTELKRIPVGNGPRAVAVAPDNEDVLILNRLGNTISIIDVGSSSLRKTISESGISRPNDIAAGMREVFGGPGFQSGTYHAFISNGGGDNMLVYESGPSGVAGLGFDNILGGLKPGDPPQLGTPDLLGMEEPRGVTYDPAAPLDTFSHTIGCYVAHNDPISGKALVSRVTYTKDDSPGQTIFNAFVISPSFGTKVFEVTQQYVSDFTGAGMDVALPDYRRDTFETSDWRSHTNLLNAGAVIQGSIAGAAGLFPRNSKYPVSTNLTPAFVNGPRWNPDRVYLLIGGGIIDVFDVTTGLHRKTIPVDGNPTVLTSYFDQ
jgi:YVTN family beta-propeller protein